LAQALAGAALSGKSGEHAEKTGGYDRAERTALGKLLANWRCVMENVESRDDRASLTAIDRAKAAFLSRRDDPMPRTKPEPKPQRPAPPNGPTGEVLYP